jgi:hypothetical protein
LVRLTWAEQRRQWARLKKAGLSDEAAKLLMPMCGPHLTKALNAYREIALEEYCLANVGVNAGGLSIEHAGSGPDGRPLFRIVKVKSGE